METNEILVVHSGTGSAIQVGNSRLFLKLLSGRINNRFSITEYELPASFPGPPAHKHRNYEHAWYIMEGALSVEVDGTEMTLSKGDFVFIPKQVIHAFSNKSDATTRLLAIDTPGGFEKYYDELEAAFKDGKPLDPDTFRQIQLKYDTYPPDYTFE